MKNKEKQKKCLFANSNHRGYLNKAFTLIELLAIIVILAIIAVITVPIILNVIESAKKGSTVDSAYGYKDSVQKYYISKFVTNPNDEAPTGVKTVSELTTAGLTVSGETPSDGWVQLNKGQVVDYSLKFGDYVVSFDTTTNTAVATKNGELKEQPILELTMDYMCPGCVYKFVDYGGSFVLHIGDELAEGTYEENYEDVEENVFCGFILDGESKITRAFACGIEKNEPFCIEGYNTDSSVYSKNMNILTSVFGDTWDETTFKGCLVVEEGWFECQGEVVGADYDYSGDFIGRVDTYNFVPSDYMTVESDGEIWNNRG